MIWTVILILIGIFYFGKVSHRLKFCNWYKQHKDLHHYTSDSIRELLNDLSRDFNYSSENIPYGRAKWFVDSDERFSGVDSNDLEFFGFSPIRSKIEEEFLEYGLLLSQDGIYYREQIDNEDRAKDKDSRYIVKSQFYPFDGLWRAELKKSEIYLYYPNRIENLKYKFQEDKQREFVSCLNSLINTGYTADLYGHYIEKSIKKSFESQQKYTSVEKGTQFGGIGGLYAILSDHLKDIQFNSIASANMGHGHAAEFANHTVDRIKHPFQAKLVGRENLKNGADRIVGNQKIQTKYHAKAMNTINSAFESKDNGGLYRYDGMQLEVPKDQYNDSIKLMKQKIEAGKVPGHQNPEDAYKIIRKGSVTYNEAKLIAKGGNLTSLSYDALDGAITSLPAAGISFVIVFMNARWTGSSKKEAASLALGVGLKTLAIGTIVYATSQQIGKIATKRIVDITGKKMAAQVVAQRAAGVISIGLIIGPDLFDALQGRISGQQLLKNSLVAGGGMVGGMAAGVAAGAVLGPIGATLGAVVGGTLVTIGAKSVLDNFFEDDRVEMFAILKEEFIDILMSMSLSKEEFQEIQDNIFDKELNNKLKDMFQQKQTSSNKVYTRESIIEKEIEKVIAKRSVISENDILEAIKISENEFVV